MGSHGEALGRVTGVLVYRRVPKLVSRQLQGSVYVAGPGREHQRLDGAAAVVWEALVLPGSAQALTDAISAHWQGHEVVHEAMIEAALAVLVDSGLVQAEAEAAS